MSNIFDQSRGTWKNKENEKDTVKGGGGVISGIPHKGSGHMSTPGSAQCGSGLNGKVGANFRIFSNDFDFSEIFHNFS